MKARLVVVGGGAGADRLELDPAAEGYLLGRGEGAALVLEGPQVSRRQAMVRFDPGPGRWVVEDLGSAAGTRLNGRYLRAGPVPLSPGDRLEIGAAVLAFEGDVEPAPAGAAATAPAGGREPGAALLAALAGLLAAEDEDPGPRLAAMLEALATGFDADRAMLWLAPRPGAALEVAATHRPPTSALPVDLAVSRRLIARAAAADGPLLLDSAATAAAREELGSIGAPLASILAAPLPHPDGTGVLYLDSAEARRAFAPSDRELLAAFARAAGDTLARARARAGARLAHARLAALAEAPGDAALVGTSPAFRRVLEAVARAARSGLPVLVAGEAGTGKEAIVRALVRAGPRAHAPFVAVPCAALPAGLVESELFGHEAGAFTGAAGSRPGSLELAAGGTLFLDEVDALPLPAQAKLLAALAAGSVQRLGGERAIPLDLRLVSTTRLDLEALAARGAFRPELYYRLAGLVLVLPPLRERGEDPWLLARHFAAGLAARMGLPPPELPATARALILAHPWPGNLRELRNALEAALVRSGGGELGPEALRPSLGPARAGAAGAPGAWAEDLDSARLAFERRFVAWQLARRDGNMQATAKALGLTRRGLYAKCEELGIDYDRLRG